MKFTRLILFPLFFAVVSCVGWQDKNTDQASLHLQMGTTLLKQNQIPQAISELQQATAENPNDSRALFYLGQAYYLRKKYDLADQKMREALKLDPKNSEIRYGLTQVEIAAGRFAGAILNLRKISQDLTYPYPDIIFENMGYCYFQLKKYDEAEKNYVQALDLQNRNCAASTGLGKTLYEKSKHAESLRALAQALTNCPSDHLEEVYYYSALDYLKLQNETRAKSSLKDLIQFFPDGVFRAKAEAMISDLGRYQ